MHIELRKSGDVIIVDLKGKLSAGLGDQILRETIDELLGENWKKILLNLSQVSFMDSAGLGELVAGLKTARNFGATLKILNQSARVQQSLYITRWRSRRSESGARCSSLFRREADADGIVPGDLQLDRALRAIDALAHVQLVAVELEIGFALRTFGHGGPRSAHSSRGRRVRALARSPSALPRHHVTRQIAQRLRARPEAAQRFLARRHQLRGQLPRALDA